MLIIILQAPNKCSTVYRQCWCACKCKSARAPRRWLLAELCVKDAFFASPYQCACCAVPVLGRFRVSLEHPTLDALDLAGAQTGLALGADGQLLLNVVNLRAVVLAGFSYRRTSFPVRRALRHGCALWPPCLRQCMSMYAS